MNDRTEVERVEGVAAGADAPERIWVDEGGEACITPGTPPVDSLTAYVRADIADRMLEALRECLDELTHPDHTPGDWSVQVVVKKARAAIASATRKPEG